MKRRKWKRAAEVIQPGHEISILKLQTMRARKLLGSGAVLRYEWSRDGGYRTRMTRRIVETILDTRGTARGGDGQFPGWSRIARDLLRKTTDSFLRSLVCHAPGSQLRSSGLPRIILFRPCRCSCLIIIQRHAINFSRLDKFQSRATGYECSFPNQRNRSFL